MDLISESPEREVVQKKRKNNPGKLKEVSTGGETRVSQSKTAYSRWRVDEEVKPASSPFAY
ncbi:unnamed protein product [Ilex paraguariensis]|uniref:Uncharacterized protein n=1 Tax=Ilex paraguariensis TaxID=185542 RepID=A0ABC8UXD5_9AQUA